MIATQIRTGPWVDTIAPISPPLAKSLAACGTQGVFRYVPFAQSDGSPQVDRTAFIHEHEVDSILGAGLQLGLVTDVRSPPWLPRMANPTSDAKAAAQRALSVGYPPGAHLWLDWEGVAGAVTDSVVYLETWAETVLQNGFKAGLYVGYSCILSPTALYQLQGFDTYWQASGSHVSTRGFAIRQSRTVTIADVQFDEDYVAPDLLGALPFVAMSGVP